jgi:glycerophosphoryl diester phosphodiesterase
MTIFSHRGFCPNDKSKQNSIEAFVASRDAGFKAIELDLWLVEDEWILKHDQPQKNELNHLTRFD